MTVLHNYDMNEMLRRYISEVIETVLSENPRVANQLVKSQGHKGIRKNPKDESEEVVDEMSSVGGSLGGGSLGGGGGFTGPLGLSSEDMKGPGAGKKKKKNRKSLAVWK